MFWSGYFPSFACCVVGVCIVSYVGLRLAALVAAAGVVVPIIPFFLASYMASYPILLRRLLRPRSSFSLAASLPYFVHPFS